MNHRNTFQTAVSLVAVIFLSVGCGSKEASPTATLASESLAATSTSVPPTSTPTSARPTLTHTPLLPTATSTPRPPTSTPLPPTATPVPPTPTPDPYPQLYVAFQEGAIHHNACCDNGTSTFCTVAYGPNKDQSFWQFFPDIPKPNGEGYGTCYGHRILDICTDDGYEINWVMGPGRIVEARPGVLTVLITEGTGQGLKLTIQHARTAEGLDVGSIVNNGDIIAYTARELNSNPNDASVTAIGVLGDSGYRPGQEMMLIGPDGVPNIMYHTHDGLFIPAFQ